MRRVAESSRFVPGRLLMVMSTVALTLAAAASPASASAVGYGKVAGYCFEAKGTQICLPSTTIGHFIKGSGRTITREEASIQDTLGADTAGGRWCNWRIDWRYSDTDGHTYLTSQGRVNHKCADVSSMGRIDTTRRTLKHYGKACADFYAGGARRGTQCHNIIE
ncbi:hypothetical protein OG607_19785 [Streptomyces sp. NBC_01537]|uniref:hypothetical protein n=1 Tax=Streptomyces sp. NBC_01537 TaxID=2903896 RepID=UPI00386ABDDF